MTTNTQPAASEGSRRSRWPRAGPGRRLAIGVSLGLIAYVAVTIGRIRSLDGLPDVGDPFDVPGALGPDEMADADNAFVAYAEARRNLVFSRNPVDEVRWSSLYEAAWAGETEP